MSDNPKVSKNKPKEVWETGGTAIYEGDTKKYILFPRVDEKGNMIVNIGKSAKTGVLDVNVVGGGGGIPLVLGWNDVQTVKDIEHPEQIEIVDEQKAFDKNIFTYARFTFHSNGSYGIFLRKPSNISGMTIFGVPPSEITKLTYYITYVDGTRDIGNPEHITDTGGYIPINPLKKCLAINLKNDTENDISVNIFEFLIYTVLQVVITETDISDVFNAELSVDVNPEQISTDTLLREEITILADANNTDKVLVGNSTNQKFPLVAGAGLTLRKVKLADVYVKANSGTQKVYVIAGGGHYVY